DCNPESALLSLVATHPDGYAVLARVLRGEGQVYKAPEMVARVINGGESDMPPTIPPDQAKALVPALLEVFRNDPAYRADMAEVLGILGEPARMAIPVLRASLAEADPDDPCARYVRETLARLECIESTIAPDPNPQENSAG